MNDRTDKKSGQVAQKIANQASPAPGEWEGAEDNTSPTDPIRSHGELTEGRSDALPHVSQSGQMSGYSSEPSEAQHRKSKSKSKQK